MKIAILSRTQNKVNRGVESFVKELSTRLSKNHQVEVLSGEMSDSFQKMIKGGFDVVIPMNGRLQGLKASFGRLFGRYKVISIGEAGIGRDEIWDIAICKPDVFVALTDYMAEWAKGFAWGTKVIKIPNGVDLDKFKSNGEKSTIDLKHPVVISVGALTWYKYHEKTIEAISRLDDVSLLIVGQGEEQERLEKLGKEKLDGRFKIISTPFEDIPKLYRAADLFTLPSWDREAFGIVYIEAMATNLAVVAPNDPPRKEIVGDGGLLTDPDNPDEFAKVIKKALEKNWGDLPRKQSEKFSWEKVVEEYEKCLKSL